GAYRAGLPTASTAVNAPYYHTTRDTPDKVDMDRLAATVDAFDRALDALASQDPDAFKPHDSALWRVHAGASPGGTTVRVTDADGVPQAGAQVQATLLENGFFAAGSAEGQTDTAGNAVLHLDRLGGQGQIVHISCGRSYPLAEALLPVSQL